MIPSNIWSIIWQGAMSLQNSDSTYSWKSGNELEAWLNENDHLRSDD